jgi:aminoglycoside 3-N-acetyltransferase
MQELDYLELASQLGIPPGCTLMVTADLTRLAIISRQKQVPFRIDALINGLQQHLGPVGTLLVPAFNFNLKNKDYFNPSKSLPVTGALAAATLQRSDFVRTCHPLHSFLVWGKYAPELVALQNRSSFGSDSPFAFLRSEKALMLLIDTTISAAFTFVHYVEEMNRVHYRKYQNIRLKIDNNAGMTEWKEFLLFAKQPGWTMRLNGLEEQLMKNHVAKIYTIDKISFTMVDLAAAYPLIEKDILENGAKNISQFSSELYLREKAKRLLAAFGIHTLADKISHDPGLL